MEENLLLIAKCPSQQDAPEEKYLMRRRYSNKEA